MALSDAAVRAAKPGAKPYKLADKDGLYLLVSAKGRYWRFDYRFAGKRKTHALGVYPEVGLGKAREALYEAREQLRKGIDPGLARKIAKSLPRGGGSSFEAVGREWFARQKPTWADSHADKVLLRLEADLYPWLGARDVAAITAPELLLVIRKVEQRGAIESAHRCLQYASSIFRYAIATSRAERNPAPDLRGALAPAVRGSFATIHEPRRIGALLRAIDAYPGGYVVACALKLAPLLFVRPTELRLMEWAEIDGAEWRIPAEKMKMRRPHIVPLPTQAAAIIESLRPLTGAGTYVLSTRHTRPLSDGALRMALKSLGYDGSEQTVHGFRSMASTLLNEQGWNRDAIERQLAHVEGGVRGAYNYAQFLPERRTMMQAWADYLDNLRNDKSPASRMG